MSDIELVAVSKRFDDTIAVDGISLRADAGSFRVLLGPSGCGKSMTLRLIAGLEGLSEGRILIGGEDVGHLPPARRGVAPGRTDRARRDHSSQARARGLPFLRGSKRPQARALSIPLTNFWTRSPASADWQSLRWQVHAWRLILPAVGLLAAFTHYPNLAFLVASFFSAPRRYSPTCAPRRPPRQGSLSAMAYASTAPASALAAARPLGCTRLKPPTSRLLEPSRAA